MPGFSLNRLSGLYRIDALCLLLCMATGHIIIGNPFYGAVVYLFSDIIKACFLCNVLRLKKVGGENYLSNVVVALVFMAGLGVAFIYPTIIDDSSSHYVSLLALCIVVRNYFGSVSVFSEPFIKGIKYYLSVLFVHICFDLCCASLLWNKVELREFFMLMGGVLFTGIIKIIFPEIRLSPNAKGLESKYETIASYKLFSDMNLYSSIAVNVGIMVFFFFMLIPLGSVFDPMRYAGMLFWLVVVMAVLVVASVVIRKRWRGFALAEFIVGTITWLFGTIMMYQDDSLLMRLLWTLFWGFGIAMLYSSVRQFRYDFAAIGSIEGYDKEDLRISNIISSTVSSIISSVIILLIMALWTFLVPVVHDKEFPKIFSITAMQIPILFMGVALGIALRHPLDFRNREKLMRFIKDRSSNERMKESLKKLFVQKYRMRFGIKIIASFVKPFLRLKVSGKENLRKNEFPSVFVSNHNFLFGPVAAVLYLPSYFRPWIHDVMLDVETTRKEISRSFAIVLKIFGKRVGGYIIKLGSKLTCWALNSFNPIPVVRGVSQKVMTTFEESLKAFEEGDNILIFPEKPLNIVVGSGGPSSKLLRNFYTGFAHLAHMYYQKTGKALLFYPLYSDLDTRTFRVGEPVLYDVSLDGREGKLRLSEQLHEAMVHLSEIDKKV